MKRVTTIITFIVFLCAIPFSATIAQENKTEKKIKVVVTSDTGTEIVIDTLIKDGETSDSIRVKGGKVIFIGHSGDKEIVKHTGDNENVYVYVSSGDKKESKDGKTVTIFSSDAGTWTEKGENTKVIVMNSEPRSTGSSTAHYSFITTESNGESSHESTEDITRSIIAKDGMVVTVEGKDEEKVNELVKEIQKKMGVKIPADDTKAAEKGETKK